MEEDQQGGFSDMPEDRQPAPTWNQPRNRPQYPGQYPPAMPPQYPSPYPPRYPIVYTPVYVPVYPAPFAAGPPAVKPKPSPGGRACGAFSLVIGIASVCLLFFVWMDSVLYLSVGLPVIGLLLAVVGRKLNSKVGASSGMITAALVLNITALAIASVLLIGIYSCTALVEELTKSYSGNYSPIAYFSIIKLT